jgi:hypothetical protein
MDGAVQQVDEYAQRSFRHRMTSWGEGRTFTVAKPPVQWVTALWATRSMRRLQVNSLPKTTHPALHSRMSSVHRRRVRSEWMQVIRLSVRVADDEAGFSLRRPAARVCARNGPGMLQRNMIEPGCRLRSTPTRHSQNHKAQRAWNRRRSSNRICTRERIHAIRSHAKRLEN